MGLVIDASLAAAWILPDEHNEASDAVLRQLMETTGSVPSLFWHEVRNIFLISERRGRLPSGQAQASMLRLRRLPLEDSGSGSDEKVLALATIHGLTAYDAAYLELALSKGEPLATTDQKLAAAARREGVALFGPLRDE